MQEKAVIGFGARTFSQRPSLNTNLALDRKSRYMPKYINSAESVLFKKSSVLFGLAQASSSIRKQNHVIVSFFGITYKSEKIDGLYIVDCRGLYGCPCVT
jgi:hypothetical protein